MIGKALNKIGGLFGLGGGQGDYYVNPPLQSLAKDKLDEALRMGDNAQVQKLVQGIGGGKMSLAEILQGATDVNQDSALQYLASAPVAGSALASQQVVEDPLLAGMYGDNSSMSRAVDEEKNLMSRGYSLQPEDYEAYGQGSDNIARMFGAQEQSLAQALSDRGLASAPSGVAAQQFSGLYGNKAEQLGQLQRQIAGDRMQKNVERLAQTRNYLTNIAGVGQSAQSARFGQNQQANANMQDLYGKDIAKYSAENAAAQASQASKEQNRKLGLGDALASGIYKGVESGTSSFIASGGGSNPAGALGSGGGGGASVGQGMYQAPSGQYSADSLQQQFNAQRRR